MFLLAVSTLLGTPNKLFMTKNPTPTLPSSTSSPTRPFKSFEQSLNGKIELRSCFCRATNRCKFCLLQILTLFISICCNKGFYDVCIENTRPHFKENGVLFVSRRHPLQGLFPQLYRPPLANAFPESNQPTFLFLRQNPSSALAP